MVGRAQMGRCDRCLRQAFPENAGDCLGGIPAIFFGDFAHLPPIGDTPLYATTSSARKHALTMEGRHVFESFNKSITLSRIFRQEGNDPEQIQFRDALM
jgi:ATP-dependent DNA helicase PIF1